MIDLRCRARRSDNGEWVEGYYNQRPITVSRKCQKPENDVIHEIIARVDGKEVRFCVMADTVQLLADCTK